MKGISAVIGALIVLIITIVLGGLAYTYISNTATKTISYLFSIDPTTSSCSGTTITVGVINDGTSSITLDKITISGTKADGTAITSTVCGAAATTLSAGGKQKCTNTVTGAAGNNNIVVTGSGASGTGVIAC